MIKLQNILLPDTETCTEERMFFRRKGNIFFSLADDSIKMGTDGIIELDTYFNGFSINKWSKYTDVKNVSVALDIKGNFRISLVYRERKPGKLLSRVISEQYVNTNGKREVREFSFDTELNNGMYAVMILSLDSMTEVFGGYYFTNDDLQIRDTKIAINICTFKREKYVYKNLNKLNKTIFNENSECKDKFLVYISDNAHTLDKSYQNKHVKISENKNVGGAGGFTRGMIEILKDSKDVTHVLMMDDDVVIQPESLYRTYKILSLLKEQYVDAFVGGAMLRTDDQWFQTEAGGTWNSGSLISHKQGLDLRSLDACLYNEVEEGCEFNAWWYCVVPINVVREDNLPLPIFIRGDDVEFGMRNMKYLILLNGICVWHEPFEYKYSSSMYYYILRNRLIDNSVDNKPYSYKEFKRNFKDQFFRELFTLRYKNAQLLIDGVRDYLKGIDFLKESDGETLNKDVMSRGYKLQYVDELPVYFDYPTYENTLRLVESKKEQRRRKLRLNGMFAKHTKTCVVPVINPHIAYFNKAHTALNYDVASGKGFMTYFNRKEQLNLILEYRRLMREFKQNYSRIRKEYFKRQNEIKDLSFWNKYLGLV